MKTVWATADCIVSPLGITTSENFTKVCKGTSALSTHSYGTDNVHAGKVDLALADGLSRFENICASALGSLLKESDIDVASSLLILSTTKGNIDFLESGKGDHPRIHLHSTAAFLAKRFGFTNHLVVSNACISGVLAIAIAKRYIESNKYEHVIVLGADVLSDFVVSGFRSLHALSDSPCKPFDKDRNGINLGEAAGAILLTSRPAQVKNAYGIRITGAATTNDANHISGPSRSGDELSMAIERSLASAGIRSTDIDFICAHGTATRFNDEMESKAFAHSGLNNIPLNSLKGYYGHTLGAAGIIETIICMHSMLNNLAIRSLGYEENGVSCELNVCTDSRSLNITKMLKTASGFGGCNSALILEK